MATDTHTTTQDLVWKNMNEQFWMAEIREQIKALPPSTHNEKLEIESRCGVWGKLQLLMV